MSAPRLRPSVVFVLLSTSVVVVQCSGTTPRHWLAGDSHVHSHWSPNYDRTQTPPEPLKGGGAIYSTPQNAMMARRHGLSWMVTTDHGGPNHSKFNMTQAYPELQESRQVVPEVLQFYGMELNMPGMDHHTLIVPQTEDEWSILFEIESRFDANESWPSDPERRTEEARRRALEHMSALPRLPLVFANHPSRSATGIGQYGNDEPWELRENNELAPDVYRGMEGAPGHQAGTLASDGTPRRDAAGVLQGNRGGYATAGAHTLGGFDQMTAIVGGFWAALLGEGRRFWVVATSDSHVHYTETSRRGSDFWPGEFHKTYVYARREYGDVLDGLRAGRVFAVAGDLVAELDVVAVAAGRRAGMGGTLEIGQGEDVTVEILFRDPDTLNANGDNPRVARVDLILGEVRGDVMDLNEDRNETTRVIARVSGETWTQDGDRYSMSIVLPPFDGSVYVRVRGTNSQDEEPRMDQPGESPWNDLWFYSNPIFIEPLRNSNAGAQ